MIGWLRGRPIGVGPGSEVLLDVGGVGYRVSVPASALAALSGTEGSVELFVHTHVREDAIVLYGFTVAEERAAFEALIGAHGVGPALALGIVTALGPDGLSRAVAEEDVEVLCTVPGIGRKTAARLVIDLREKLGSPSGARPASSLPAAGTGSKGEVRAALAELGYGPDEIRRALQALPESESAVEDMLRSALRELAGAR